MSAILASLKARLADIPGIESMSMQLLAGRQSYSIGGKVVSVDATATEDEAEAAIRAALGSLAVAQMPAGTPVAAPAVPASSSSALLPQVNMTANQESTTMSITGAGGAGLSLKAMIQKRKAKIQADIDSHMKAIEAEFDVQDQVVAGLGALPGKIKSETSDLAASIGQFANDILGESK
ncbi:hypothetical protein ACE10Z_23630 [Bradyrhizobium sp. Pha-3]|uniref:hypothetical protein n=1 Tax=Bradyrhizobium sp. Pha-3 TaxID=208375 RepID=UPI0035D3FA04